MRRPAMRRPCLLLRWGRERAPGPANVCVCEHMWMCRSAVACTICRKAEDFFFFFFNWVLSFSGSRSNRCRRSKSLKSSISTSRSTCL